MSKILELYCTKKDQIILQLKGFSNQNTGDTKRTQPEHSLYGHIPAMKLIILVKNNWIFTNFQFLKLLLMLLTRIERGSFCEYGGVFEPLIILHRKGWMFPPSSSFFFLNSQGKVRFFLSKTSYIESVWCCQWGTSNTRSRKTFSNLFWITLYNHVTLTTIIRLSYSEIIWTS